MASTQFNLVRNHINSVAIRAHSANSAPDQHPADKATLEPIRRRKGHGSIGRNRILGEKVMLNLASVEEVVTRDPNIVGWNSGGGEGYAATLTKPKPEPTARVGTSP